MALADAPTAVCARRTAQQTKLKDARTAFATKEPQKTRQAACLQLRLQRNPRLSSSAGSKKKKKCSTLPPVSLLPIWGIPKICLDLPCSQRRWVGVGSGAVDGGFYFHAFFPPSSCYCSALMSRPCHGSMLAFLFPESRDRIAAQLRGTGPVPLR